GTPAFMSPEHVEGATPSTASDVFSRASLLVWAATGTGPFGEGSPVTLLRRIRTAEPEPRALPGPVRVLARRVPAPRPRHPADRGAARRPPPARPVRARLAPARRGRAPARPGHVPRPAAARPRGVAARVARRDRRCAGSRRSRRG